MIFYTKKRYLKICGAQNQKETIGNPPSHKATVILRSPNFIEMEDGEGQGEKMKLKLFLPGLLIIALTLLNYQAAANEYEGEYELPDPMADFIPDNLATIRNLIRKHKNVDAKYINNDLAITVNQFYGVPHAKEKIKKTSFLILFKVPQKKDVQSDASETLKDFMNGKTDNMKEIFWSNQDKPFSWSKASEELKFEKRCVCGCVTGIFSSRLCMMSECPLANQANEK